MIWWENPEVESNPAVTEVFLEGVLAAEKAGWSVPAERLKAGGLELVPPDELDDETLTKKLRELLHAMAMRGIVSM